MLILDETDINKIGINWEDTLLVIEDAIYCIANGDYAQPVKPYLRYRNIRNRIIAMPAFVGGNINMAGIKWIASFPGNIENGLPRAHSVTILNDAETGQPVASINTVLLSIIRTASVSGLVIKHFFKNREVKNIKIGIIGFGPIGQYHLQMCRALFEENISNIYVYDIFDVTSSGNIIDQKVQIVNSWEEAYNDSDILITCTVSNAPYIDKQPKSGSIHLNVSLRDYKPEVYDWFKNAIIVDDWDEVCREKTDIEIMHLEKGLNKEGTKSIVDVVINNCFDNYDAQTSIMFNPMGMAVFDIAIGSYYFKKASVLDY